MPIDYSSSKAKGHLSVYILVASGCVPVLVEKDTLKFLPCAGFRLDGSDLFTSSAMSADAREVLPCTSVAQMVGSASSVPRLLLCNMAAPESLDGGACRHKNCKQPAWHPGLLNHQKITCTALARLDRDWLLPGISCQAHGKMPIAGSFVSCSGSSNLQSQLRHT